MSRRWLGHPFSWQLKEKALVQYFLCGQTLWSLSTEAVPQLPQKKLSTEAIVNPHNNVWGSPLLSQLMPWIWTEESEWRLSDSVGLRHGRDLAEWSSMPCPSPEHGWQVLPQGQGWTGSSLSSTGTQGWPHPKGLPSCLLCLWQHTSFLSVDTCLHLLFPILFDCLELGPLSFVVFPRISF